jgi:nucleotide-binding universal stress UspA family protein
MYPFRNILFPTDFSPHSRAALKYAAAFAREASGEVVLFNVQETTVPPDLLTLADHIFEDPENHWLIRVRSDLRDLLADPVLAGVRVEPVIVEGDPASAITRAAIDHDVDLITVVTRGRKGLSRALGASIAEEIIAEAPCPVLAIRPPQRDFVQHRERETTLQVKRILLATNFRPSSAAATQIASQFANHQLAELHVLYVIGDYFEQISAMFPEGGLAALKRLRGNVQERMARMSRMGGGRTITHIAEGRPYEEIARCASQADVDLIVIGTAVHNSLFGGSLVLGSEVERVIRNSPCPVLCVPATRAVTPLPAFVAQPA